MKLCWSGAMSQSTAGTPRSWLNTRHHNSTGTPAWARRALVQTTGAENRGTISDGCMYWFYTQIQNYSCFHTHAVRRLSGGVSNWECIFFLKDPSENLWIMSEWVMRIQQEIIGRIHHQRVGALMTFLTNDRSKRCVKHTEDVNLERRRDSGAFGDKGWHLSYCTINKHTPSPVRNL